MPGKRTTRGVTPGSFHRHLEQLGEPMTEQTVPRVWSCCDHCDSSVSDACEVGHTTPCLTCQVDSPTLDDVLPPDGPAPWGSHPMTPAHGRAVADTLRAGYAHAAHPDDHDGNPPGPWTDEDEDRRPCGCMKGDPHQSDCDLFTGGTGRTEAEWHAILERRDPEDVDSW